MAMVVISYLFIVACCSYAAIIGGATERWATFIFLSAALLTSLASWHTLWARSDWPMAIIDFYCFLALYVLAVKSGRYWPIWSAGFQLLSVLTHVAVFLDPSSGPKAYRAMETVWALPALLSMVIGAHADRRGRIGGVGHEPGRSTV
jgi:hypothetical protein